MSEENNDCSKCLANGVYCQKCYPRPDVPYLSKEKKRTISLEAYLKMQNDWAIELVSWSNREKNAKDAVDDLLKHNNVVVEGE